MNVFVELCSKARNKSEKEYFEKMITMMLCLRKYERLKSIKALN